MPIKAPTEESIASELGSSYAAWRAIMAALDETHGPLLREWKPSKSDFGSICLLKLEKRTLLYLTPAKNAVIVAIVLGERAVTLALASELPHRIKKLIEAAPRYAEGRGIRFEVSLVSQVKMVCELVEIKVTPK